MCLTGLITPSAIVYYDDTIKKRYTMISSIGAGIGERLANELGSWRDKTSFVTAFVQLIIDSRDALEQTT
jgi:hypothetical protein